MENFSKKFICFLSFFVLLFGVYGCGDDEGTTTTTTTTTNPTISGKVVDGYVSGATVYVYNSTDMKDANLIGNGTTDSNGDFSITLNVSSLPSIIYIKTVGGVDINTGLPAPTMFFVGNSTGTSAYNITPFTDKLYSYFIKTNNLANATNTLAGKLGINATDIYGDPMQSDTLSNLLWQILAAQTGAGIIPDGNYTVTIIYMAKSDVDDNETIADIDDLVAKKKLSFNATIVSGVINGTLSGRTVTGKVAGSAMLMNIMGTNSLVRVAGKIGQYGGVSGIYTEFDNSSGNPDLDRGIFVASFVNSANMNNNTIAGMSNLVSKTFTGKKHFVYWDIFTNKIPRVGFAYSNVTSANITSGTITAQDINLYRDTGNNVTANPVVFSFKSGTFMKDGSMPLGIGIMKFKDGNSVSIFIVSHIGNREALFFKTKADGTVFSVGKCAFTPDNNFAPKLEMGAKYHLQGVLSGPFMLGEHRKNVLSWNTFSGNMTPGGAGAQQSQQHPPYMINPIGEVVIFGGSTIVMKKDLDDDFSDEGNGPPEDYINIINIYDTGAGEGMNLGAGNHTDPFTNQILPNRMFPVVYVGYFNKIGEPIPSVNGTLNFLARAIYTTIPEVYMNAYVYGNLTISGDTAVLRYESANPTVATGNNATLTVTNTEGIYHMYGALPSGDYMDIYWPVGGYTAIYMVSDNATTANGTITELGEAFITP